MLVYLAAWPVPVEPEAWTPPEAIAPREQWPAAQWKPEVEVVEIADGYGPEDVDVDAQGRVYGGLHDGRILRWSPGDWAVEELANTGGRPLGLQFDRDGALLIADAHKGLLRLVGKTLETLTTTCGGRPLVFTDDLDVAADGSVWFSDASERFGQPRWKYDILENKPNGRLCRYDPSTGETEQILGGLYFANGVAIDPEQRYVLVNETSRYRVLRYWMSGPRAGTHEVIIDNLPGFPDGISTGSGGRFWLALAGPRDALVDAIGPYPALRKVIVRLPAFIQPAPKVSLQVLGMDGDGRVLHHAVMFEEAPFSVVTSVEEAGGRLYLGSLSTAGFASMPTP
jgi:sugar lactone lactonase YvrE